MTLHEAAAANPAQSAKPPREGQSRRPGDQAAISTYFGRSVYDHTDRRLGEVLDLVLGADGRIVTAVIFTTKYFGLAKRIYEVPFSSLQVRTHDRHCYLVMQSPAG